MKPRAKLIWFASILAAVCLILTIAAAATGKPSFLRNAAGAIVTPLQNVVSAATDRLADFFGYFYRYDELERENAELRAQLEEYRRMETTYYSAINQNAALREAAGIKRRHSDFDMEMCSVVSVTGNGFESSMTLNRGSASGVEEGDSVITGDGLVGFVSQVGLNHCVVKTVIHVDFTASAAVARTREVVVTNGSFELASDGLLKVSYLENDADLRLGDVIVTNGGAYPPDLTIGKVTDFRQEKHGISSYASVEPTVDFNELSTVFVVKDFTVEN